MILVAGEALIDLLIDPQGRVTAAQGGGPFNAARTIGRLGVAAQYVGRLSVDRFGRALAQTLTDDGVDIGVGDPCAEPTTLAAAELDEQGAASYRFYISGTSAPALRPADLPDMSAAAAVHVGSLALVLEPMARTLLDALASVPGSAPVMVDLNCRPLAIDDHAYYRGNLDAFVRRANIVKASTEDLEFLAGDVEPVVAARRLLDAGATAVLVTDGSRPVNVVVRDGVEQVEVPSVEVVDTVGAGDAFGAAVLAWWVDHGHGVAELADLELLRRAAVIGASVSAVNCTRAGANPPRRSELADW